MDELKEKMSRSQKCHIDLNKLYILKRATLIFISFLKSGYLLKIPCRFEKVMYTQYIKA